MQSRSCPGCGARPRDAADIGADLAELLVRVRAELPALRPRLPPPEEPAARECALMNRWMGGLGVALDVRQSAWPLTLELQHGMCPGCACRRARRRRKAEDAPPSAGAPAEVVGHA